MHLHAERGDLEADVGGKRLGDRRQQLGARPPVAPLVAASASAEIGGDGAGIADGAARRGQRPHRQQHAAHVGMRRRSALIPVAGQRRAPCPAAAPAR